MKNSSSESVVGTKKRPPSEGCCGSVFERLSFDIDIVVCSLGWLRSPHVSCRRRGFEDGPGTTREELVLDEVLNTADEYTSATMTRGKIVCTHSLALRWQ